jgi:tRNA(Ser,Leu) C12 N-acetylase TAN1
MQEWNAVISVHEHGFKKALDVFGDFGEVKRTEFFNVLLMRAESPPEMLESLRTRMLERPESLSFLARLIPVTKAFIFTTAEEFEGKAREIVLTWAPRLAGKSFYVRIRRRGFKGRISSPDEERFLDTLLLEELEKAGTPGSISFEKPHAVVAIETVGHWAGLSLFTREDLETYPFIKLD